ncbi:4Fe-4S cluster-binding domain-containing protein, partial [Herbiconiux daphne]|uniref:4Fe-4S cluster-binding domain-containing protein n=1 Tax=Herbiconiux daphne TaxID=2970914 RepID=UPI0038B2DC74
MNYHQYYPTDVLNGEGIRCVLFLSGCNHGCHGCYNESTWNPNSGFPVTKDLIDQIISDLQDERIPR